MSQIRKPWTLEEDQAVKIIVKSIGTRKWSAVSSAMANDFALKARSGKQCRQRWHNHLDPDINRKPWTAQQEKIIFDSHRKYGNKWTQISLLLDGRTDNAVKNHFYSTIRRSLRRISKTLGEKNSTSQMRDIKPSVLSQIFHYAELPDCQQNNQNRNIVHNCKTLSESILEFSSIKYCVRNQNMRESQRQKLQLLYQNIMKFKQAVSYKKLQFYSSQVQISHSLSSFHQNKNIRKAQVLVLNKNYENYQPVYLTQKKESIYDWALFQKNCEVVQSFAKQYQNNLNKSQMKQQINKQFFYPLTNFRNQNLISKLIKQNIQQKCRFSSVNL